MIIPGRVLAVELLYHEKKKIIVRVVVTIKAPVNNMTFDVFDLGISFISIFITSKIS